MTGPTCYGFFRFDDWVAKSVPVIADAFKRLRSTLRQEAANAQWRTTEGLL